MERPIDDSQSASSSKEPHPAIKVTEKMVAREQYLKDADSSNDENDGILEIFDDEGPRKGELSSKGKGKHKAIDLDAEGNEQILLESMFINESNSLV